jgi:hypothetical protein
MDSGLRLVAALDMFWDHRGNHREQRERLLKALAQSDPSERTALRAKVLNQAANSEWFHRHYPEAHILADEALSIGIELKDQRIIAESLRCLLQEALSQKDFETAYLLNDKALAIWRELGDKPGVALSLMYKAHISRRCADYDYARARGVFEEAIALFTELGEKRWRAVALYRLGRITAHAGDDAAAMALCGQSLALLLETGDEHLVVMCLLTIGGIAVTRGQAIRAARLFGAAEALLGRLDIPMLFGDVYDYEQDLEALRAQLDEATLSAAWGEGRAMTLEEAVEHTLVD